MAAYQSKYHVAINAQGYILARNRTGKTYYQKKVAPVFVNKFGSGDVSYRDSTFWQFWASTNWRNGAKQLRVDDGGKYWKSSDINVTQLEEISLSRKLTSVGQTASGVKVNALAPWRTAQSWWNNNYAYRKQLTVTAAAAAQVPAGHPIKITEDTAALQTAGKVLANRNDWQVIYFNGSAWVQLKRDYVDTTSTWFGAQNAIAAGASDTSYYVYYGYSGEGTSPQPTTEADWNGIYGMYGTTPDSNSKAIFHFREGSGTAVNDDTTNANNATATGSPTWGTSGGKFGRYLTFDRVDDYLDAGASADLDLGSFTLEAWVYRNTSSALEEGVIVKPNSAGTDIEYSLYVKDGKVAARHIHVGGFLSGTTTLAISTWYHIAATYDGSNLRVYVNGALENTSAESTPTSSSTGLKIGKAENAASSSGFNGRITQARVSNTARTSFPYVLATEPSTSSGSETTTQPSQSSADLYAGCSDGKIYKWDGTTTWTEQFDIRKITWYDTVADKDNDTGHVGDEAGTERAQAQSFQIGSIAQTIKGIGVYLKKTTGTPGDITVRIETNNAGVPSGTLASASLTGTIPAFTTSTYAFVSLDFATAASLSASTTYWLVLKTAAAGNDNHYTWGLDASSPTYSSGERAHSSDGGSTWTAQPASDFLFQIKGETASVNDFLVSSVGGTLKLLVATGDITSQTNGNARLYSYNGTTWALEKIFNTTTESQITKLAEFNSKLYAGVGPQGRVFEGTSPTSWTLSKDIDVPQKPGYIYAMKEYNGRLYVGGGSPELLPTNHYSGFWYVFDGTTWTSLYPFDFTTLRSFEFYDAFLFGTTYHGHIYVYDTATLNPLFNFKDGFDLTVSILNSQLFDDKIYFLLYPQENTNETDVGVWLFDRHGLSLAHTVSGVTGFRCATVANNILFFGTGDSGYIYKLDTSNYAATGYVQTSYFDANLPSISKLYNSVIVQHDPLNAGESVVVYYKFKESESWTTLGTSNTVAATTKTMAFSAGVVGNKISLKVELNTSNPATTPKVKEVVLQYKINPTRKWLWNMRIQAKTLQGLLDRTRDTLTADQIRSAIETAQNSQALVTFVDVDGTSYSALFDSLDADSWVINQGDTNEDTIQITLLEA